MKIGCLALLAQSAYALSCSDAVTVSSINVQAVMNGEPAHISINKKGDVAVVWEDRSADGKQRENIRYAVKKFDHWSEPITISDEKGKINELSCKVDSLGGIIISYQREDDLHIWTDSAGETYSPRQIREKETFFLPALERIDDLECARWASSPEMLESLFGLLKIPLGGRVEGPQFAIWGKSLERSYWPPFEKTSLFATAYRLPNGNWNTGNSVRLPIENIDHMKVATDTLGNSCVVIVETLGDLQKIWAWTGSSTAEHSDLFLVEEQSEGLSTANVSVDKNGNFLIAWETLIRETGKMNIRTIYKPKEQAWHAPISYTPKNEFHGRVVLKPDPAGGFVMVWWSMRNEKGSVQGATFSPESCQWSSPTRLSPSHKNCIFSSFDLNEKREGVVVWTSLSEPRYFAIQMASLNL